MNGKAVISAPRASAIEMVKVSVRWAEHGSFEIAPPQPQLHERHRRDDDEEDERAGAGIAELAAAEAFLVDE